MRYLPCAIIVQHFYRAVVRAVAIYQTSGQINISLETERCAQANVTNARVRDRDQDSEISIGD